MLLNYIIDYKFFAIPILVMLINQVIKIVLEIKHNGFSWAAISGYGGMPSSHSSLVTSLAIVIGYYKGLASAEFGIALIMAGLIIRDASGIRLQITSQSKTINKLIKELPDEQEYKFPVLGEKFGHKNIEVIIGIILSIILTSVIIWLLP
ncbi:MAG: acid phosphatase [Candidatus Komeilibacteria bacterium CG11_big_fil_rev_8_21_14_0_20_36_20]|uniref:Acid phosphatase n=1 Tax=Candidatus Komeilibacteria bacterium CG11_big_fil_rev_8_21_14_0_20_36_20 TaxID=1974477 RepID=A0A2H0NE90_9BACT|nr:MAG: acid phosphatase [Candidatus Komeilibacteria bacterium CG11_big_fil_rev_8_21_14_0_20_36_20]PIR81668.1 MAG: divergent PAP2 family protein [Candidatus Komeilibacteria bacterium CG10_big_fil_rev_8_21_14_0_10_36_65]PJC55599.1 MAG: divergent PAP2 family protein [Candidatus Komeilibacteria bacterium CG_4_9_14_0_2_um_filter_36_13]